MTASSRSRPRPVQKARKALRATSRSRYVESFRFLLQDLYNEFEEAAMHLKQLYDNAVPQTQEMEPMEENHQSLVANEDQETGRHDEEEQGM